MRIATSVVVNAFLVIMETKDSWDSTNQTQKFQLNTVGKDISTQKNATPLGFLLSPCFLFSVKKMNIALQKVIFQGYIRKTNHQAGTCMQKTSSEQYNAPCIESNCEDGLQCINNICQICESDINLSYKGNMIQNDILEPASCSSGRYQHISNRKPTNPSRLVLLGTVILIMVSSMILKTGIIQYTCTKLVKVTKQKLRSE